MLVITVGGFSSHRSVWLAVLGLVLALVGLLVATGESVRHAERAASLTGVVEEPTADVYHPPGSRVWMTP